MNRTIKLRVVDLAVWTVSLLFAFGLLVNEALAEPPARAAANAKWKEECGSCHIAYPPQLLPATAWRRVMAGLDRHFGSDASLDAASAAQITAFLERNAGKSRGASGDAKSLRITDTLWFAYKHDEVPAQVWNNPRVKSAANCAACHMGAERGDFDEDAVRIPR